MQYNWFTYTGKASLNTIEANACEKSEFIGLSSALEICFYRGKKITKYKR